MLETLDHDGKNCFVTLTYAPNPEGGPYNLNPLDTQKWLKRLRKRVGKLRYYLVGSTVTKLNDPTITQLCLEFLRALEVRSLEGRANV